MIKRLIKLAIVLAIAHAAYRAIPVYIRYVQFRDALAEAARFSGGQSEEQVRGRVAQVVLDSKVPIEPDTIAIGHEASKTAIQAAYVEPVELLPSYVYPWRFEIDLDVIHVRPTSVDQIK
jgi:hypothetical protein